MHVAQDVSQEYRRQGVSTAMAMFDACPADILSPELLAVVHNLHDVPVASYRRPEHAHNPPPRAFGTFEDLKERFPAQAHERQSLGAQYWRGPATANGAPPGSPPASPLSGPSQTPELPPMTPASSRATMPRSPAAAAGSTSSIRYYSQGHSQGSYSRLSLGSSPSRAAMGDRRSASSFVDSVRPALCMTMFWPPGCTHTLAIGGASAYSQSKPMGVARRPGDLIDRVLAGAVEECRQTWCAHMQCTSAGPAEGRGATAVGEPVPRPALSSWTGDRL